MSITFPNVATRISPLNGEIRVADVRRALVDMMSVMDPSRPVRLHTALSLDVADGCGMSLYIRLDSVRTSGPGALHWVERELLGQIENTVVVGNFRSPINR